MTRSSNIIGLSSIPAPVLVVIAIFSIQIGSSFAIRLFPAIGADGAVAWRILLSALILMLICRQAPTVTLQTLIRHWRILLPYGACICAMNLCFYLALSKIPLGATVALEFMGPLGVAALTSRKLIHFVWIALAAAGVLMLSPFTGADLNPVGVAWALTAGVGWGLFILLSKKVSASISGQAGIVTGMTLAAILLLPVSLPNVGTVLASSDLMITILAVALLATALPFLFEFIALKTMAARVYGVLVSLEPAVAVVVGVVLLGENLGVRGLVAVALIVIAALAMSLTEPKATAETM